LHLDLRRCHDGTGQRRAAGPRGEQRGGDRQRPQQRAPLATQRAPLRAIGCGRFEQIGQRAGANDQRCPHAAAPLAVVWAVGKACTLRARERASIVAVGPIATSAPSFSTASWSSCTIRLARCPATTTVVPWAFSACSAALSAVSPSASRCASG